MELINQSNLLHGKTSEGGNMPSYSYKYFRGNVSYRKYKMRANPLNRGFWDLKHWWDRQYNNLFYNSIKVRVTLKEVVFTSNYDPEYMKEIYWHVSKSRVLGITKQQFLYVQEQNVKRVKPKILDIINNGK